MPVIQKYGSQCLNLVIKATECIQANPEEAQKHLATIKETAPMLLQQLEKQQTEVAAKRDELNEKDKLLKREIGAKEDDKNRKRRNIQYLHESKARNEAMLQDARRSLSTAESNKRDAQNRKDDAIIGTVAGGAGAAVLGVIFPPSLFVTIPAVATAGTISIVEADKEVDRCRGRIREIERNIDSEKQQIQSIEYNIYGIEREISSLNAKQHSLYKELSLVREAFVFLQKAVTFFSDMHVAVCAGDQKTNLLHKVVEKANEKKEYRILSSRGGTTIANSFADAWEQVEDKLQSGGENEYLGIMFNESIEN